MEIRKIMRIGNSVGVTVPQRAGLEAGDYVILTFVKDHAKYRSR
jgi:hypothetical protein